jgi:Flp pilus assembly protein TadD
VQSCQGALGNGSYALFASPPPPPSPAHDARLRPPIMASPTLCAGCHKVALTPELTHAQWLRGQNDYDAWQQSVAGGNGVASVYRPETVEPKRCQDCHMPLIRLRSGKLVRSHRFLAANAALPALRGDADMEEKTREFLRGAVSLDVVLLPGGAADEATTPSLASELRLPRTSELRFDVVLRNRRVGHRFPGGTNDSNEVWVDVQLGPAGAPAALRDATHLVRAQAVDGRAEPLAHRDPQNMRGVVYDTSLSPADPQVVRYRADLRALPATATALTLRAALRYRKFSPDYARFACAALPATAPPALRQRCQEPPIVDIAVAERRVSLLPAGRAAAESGADAAEPPPWQRYLDHGLGLADGLVDQASVAQPSLARAAALAPQRPEPLLGLARLALALGRTEEVLALGQRAAALRPDHPAAAWLAALALYRAYRFADARPYVEQLARKLPQDRNVLTLLARVRGLTGDPQAALAAAERLLAIDAESEDGHHQRLLALRELGRADEAAAAEQRYLYYRRPIELDQELRQQFRLRQPDRAFEDVPAHTHTLTPAASAP